MTERYFKPKRQEEFLAVFAREGVQAGVFLALGFVFSNALLFGSLSPMGLALCACLSGLNLYACVAGAIFGYSLMGTAGVVVKYIGAVVVIIFVKWLTAYLKNERTVKLIGVLSAAIGVFASGGILMILLKPDLYIVLSLLIETALTVVGTVLFSSALEAIGFRRPLCRMTALQISGVAAMAGIAVISLSSLRVFDASIGVMCAIFSTLFMALNSGAFAGAGVGIVFGVSLLVFDEAMFPTCLALAFGGFLAGAVNKLGKSRMALIFAVSSIFIFLLTLSDNRLIPLLIETAAGCILFLIFSFKNDFFTHLGAAEAHSSNVSDFRTVFDRRLTLASDSLSEIGDITKKVALKLQRRHEANEKNLFESTAQKVCRECSMHDYCWETRKNQVREAFESTAPELKKKGYLSAEALPEYFNSNCIKHKEILRELNLAYTEQVEAMAHANELSMVRGVICEQFDAMSLMLEKLKEELSAVHSVKGEVADRFAASLRSMGIEVEYCCATVRDFDRIAVEICVSEFSRESVPDKKLLSILKEITDRDFDYPCVREVDSKLHYVFNEKPCFDLDYKILQLSRDGGAVNGDSLSCFSDPEQFFNIILSDGMGSGKRAAVDSAMTVSLITKLIKSGFHYDNAIELVNSAMLVKSCEETLSTVDALRLDLYTGKLQILKAGAAPTFIYHSGERTHTIEAESLPIGILGGVKPEKTQVYLKSGDLIVMVSDGICDDEYMWLETLISQNNSISPKALCEMIMQSAQDENKSPDDRTVLVARVVSAK